MSGTLQANDLTKHYATSKGSLPVLRGVSLDMRAGQALSIMGPSGSGKSTLLNILGTLETPDGGSVALDGEDPFSLSPSALASLRNQRVGFIFQEHHLLPQCSVLENVLVPTLAEKQSHDENLLERAHHLLDRVGLSDRLEHRPAELSGGERQRVAIARSLINRPLLMLADEPTGNLDRKTATAVTDLLLEVHREENTILIVVTHSLGLAERFDRRHELVDGLLETV